MACSAPERDFLPSVEEYFEEAAEQLNPDAQVDKEYRYSPKLRRFVLREISLFDVNVFFRKVNDGSWGWRALRLLAKKSPHFFTYGNHPIAKLPDYLEQMLKRMAKVCCF